MKEKNINIRCSAEQSMKIKQLAKEAGLSQSDFILSKTLNLIPTETQEIKDYPHRVKGHTYSLKRLVTKTILKSPEEVTVNC